MKTTAVALSVLFLAGCASSGQVGVGQGDTATTGALPDYFHHEYEYSGQIEGTGVSGRVSFEQDGNGDVLYIMTSERATAPCRGYVRSPTESRVRLSCSGLTFDFARGGEVATRPYATLGATRLVNRRECGEWRVDPQTRQRVCAAWHTVAAEQPVTLRGTIELERVNGAG